MIINTRPKSLSKNIIKLSKDLGIDLNNVHLSEIKSLISEEKKIEWEPKPVSYTHLTLPTMFEV